MDEIALKALIRDIPDFPEPGVVFKDITPLLGDAAAFSHVVDVLAGHYAGRGVTKVAGIEARGFIFAAPVAVRLGAGFVPVRKEGKLPHEVEGENYELEYGTDLLEIHKDAVHDGDRVLIVDDVLATGGTARAAAQLVERIGGKVIGISCLIELGFLNGRSKLEGYELFTLLGY
jgi:adenine phosphoribosyltransferase